eukprot:CAMPEP_0202685288 /NCGR_PEP_ID=MMETSP1385-20130828/1048_1 /ASSEMBLY_ACC=CAM_ASM_000861 /TAXON_ID=933848 /ORGANISM="Elphidium margaritaceum" /LENGTH=224 /DNA_ID=CAMNT_0049339601 /DNA_START=102 /DNA_END=776 /DNA_ORIENTATION=+
MDDFFGAAEENTEQPQQTGDAVVVNQTASDDFAFMPEEQPQDNPYEATDNQANEEPQDAPQADTDAQAQQQPREDPFASMVDGGGDANNDGLGDDAKNNEDGTASKEKTDEEPTFLSVWQEERKLELEKRRNAEQESKKKLIDDASEELQKFESDRTKRVESKKKENRDAEKDLRDDLDAVFQHGTIWEQVGKMVNLNEKMESLKGSDKERFRDLLIHLRNAKQ